MAADIESPRPIASPATPTTSLGFAHSEPELEPELEPEVSDADEGCSPLPSPATPTTFLGLKSPAPEPSVEPIAAPAAELIGVGDVDTEMERAQREASYISLIGTSPPPGMAPKASSWLEPWLSAREDAARGLWLVPRVLSQTALLLVGVRGLSEANAALARERDTVDAEQDDRQFELSQLRAKRQVFFAANSFSAILHRNISAEIYCASAANTAHLRCA
eukprot:SAG11_NODE_1886_length_4117_cov_2.494027_5_plen_220_part_00